MNWQTCLKLARIAVNVVFFVLGLMGIKIPVSSNIKSRAIQEAGKFLWMNPVARMVIKTFILAFKNAWRKDNVLEMAISILKLVRDLQAAGLLWTIIQTLLFEMGKWDWLMTTAQVSFNVTAILSTGGWALIATIADHALSAKSLYDLIMDLF